MKIILFTFVFMSLLGMSDSQPNSVPNTPALRSFSPAVFESHYATEDIRIINVTPEEEEAFHRSIQAAHDRNNQRRLGDIESQVPQPNANHPQQIPNTNPLTKTISNNKTLILSNLATAVLGATVTLLVHFTAAK
jgi:hypothetical protein